MRRAPLADRWPDLQAAFRADERLRRAATIAATAILPGLLGLFGAFALPVWEWWPAATIVIAAVLLAGQAALFWILADRPASVGALLLAIDRVETERDAVVATRDRLAAVIARRTVLETWLRGLYPLHADALAAGRNGAAPQAVVERIMRGFPDDPRTLFGFPETDRWCFAVYLHDRGQGRLCCAWRQAHRLHPSRGPHRSWAPNEGHVGIAFAKLYPDERRRGLITPDATLPGIRAVFDALERRPYDADAYRSFASIPFGGFTDASERVGVIVGTSDRADAFTEETSEPLHHLAALLSTLAPHLNGFAEPLDGTPARPSAISHDVR